MKRSVMALVAAVGAAVLALAMMPNAAAKPDTTAAAIERDRFGVQEIYPTKAGGREWSLPADATKSDSEWGGGSHVKKTGEKDVFRVSGSPRIPVASPAGKAWWRNVEITAYYRLQGTLSGDGPAPGYQLYARGERHVTSNPAASSVNRGVRAPAGTATWPGYPFSGNINGHCLGSSYKGYVDRDGEMHFKKEISHTKGYTGSRDKKKPFAGGLPTNKWFGFKTVIRNINNNKAVQMENWLDRNADGRWVKINTVTDSGGWTGGAGLDGCTAAPFRFKQDQIITWAGPYVNFRFDRLNTDLRWLSAREIDPLP